MRDAEQAIERVLAGLREAEAPQGMEGRILQAIEERAAERNWMKMPGYAGFVAGGAVAAGVLLVVLVLPTMRKAVHVGSGRRVLNVAGALRRFEAPANDAVNGVPQRLKPQGEGGGYGTAEAVPLSKARLYETGPSTASVGAVGYRERGLSEAGLGKLGRSVSRPASLIGPARETSEGLANSQEVKSAEGALDYDALAISEMQAPSRPAPPLPLTNQEKLLAQVVHKGAPEALATLRPDVRAKQMEISKAEFEDFFEPPSVKDNE